MILQFFIVVFSCSAIWLVNRKEEWSKYGYLCGMLGQPFWLYSTYTTEQWGIFALSLFYLYSWSQGFKNYLWNDFKTFCKKCYSNFGKTTSG